VSNSPDATATLNEIAVAGGTARTGMTSYFPTTNGHDLQAALAMVARQITLCTFDLTTAPPIGDTIDLAIGGQRFFRNTGHQGDGWDFTNGGRSIALYGGACDAVQSGGAVAVTYVCGGNASCDSITHLCVGIVATGTGGAGGGSTVGSAGTGGTVSSCGGTGGTTTTDPSTVNFCHFNTQCGPGGICTGGACAPHCSSNNDCGTGDICSSGNCAANPAPGSQCTFNADCGASATCINALCHKNCAADKDCGTSADICDNGVCQPNWHRVPSCTTNAQCTGGAMCVDGACRNECRANTDCATAPSGTVCQAGYCYKPNEASPQCFLNADCGTSKICVDATCVTGTGTPG
jgi:hypothetical protein